MEKITSCCLPPLPPLQPNLGSPSPMLAALVASGTGVAPHGLPDVYERPVSTSTAGESSSAIRLSVVVPPSVLGNATGSLTQAEAERVLRFARDGLEVPCPNATHSPAPSSLLPTVPPEALSPLLPSPVYAPFLGNKKQTQLRAQKLSININRYQIV